MKKIYIYNEGNTFALTKLGNKYWAWNIDEIDKAFEYQLSILFQDIFNAIDHLNLHNNYNQEL